MKRTFAMPQACHVVGPEVEFVAVFALHATSSPLAGEPCIPHCPKNGVRPFHVWHVARWTDYLQEMINGRGSQLWEKESLAARWALETNGLGLAETGIFMDDKVVMSLPMPGKSLLLDCARRSFKIAEQTVGTIGDDQYYQIYEDLHGRNWYEGRIGPIITGWMAHDNEHLGMIECLIGVQGMHGTAND